MSRIERARKRRLLVRRRRRTAILAVLVVFAAGIALYAFIGGGDDPTDELATTAEPTPDAPETTSSVSPQADGVEPTATVITEVIEEGDGTWTYATGTGDEVGDSGTLLTYNVAVEDGIELSVDEFTDFVAETLGNSRNGWITGGAWRFQQVPGDRWADFTIYLASPQTRAELCGTQDTFTSCRNGDSVVINSARWLTAVDHWPASLELYRQYVINHEVGHRLGEGHVVCPEEGTPSPVMAQQTYALRGCEPNAWPYLHGELVTGPPGEYE